jgi:tetratricopeptide (TPR) repeat protein
MKNEPNIFISYSWQTKNIADKISSDLSIIGINVIKDNTELKYSDDIQNFMKRIRLCDYALLLISDNYLKSRNCLFEIHELQKEEQYWKKILPIVWEDVKIGSAIDRLHYVDYWERKSNELEKALKNLSPINSSNAYNELKLLKDISYQIEPFLKKISDTLHYTPTEIIEKNYQPIIEKIGTNYEPKSLIALIALYLTDNLEQREIELDKYIKKYPESSFYYSLKAHTAKQQKKYNQAIHFYEEGLKIDSDSFEILNNLGQLIEYIKNDKQRAKELYEKAIKVNPKSAIPRLNLGNLLDYHFNDREKAKEQYDIILKFDSQNAKAHNNLSGYYKTGNKKTDNIEKIEYHLLKALEINPNYIDALINYGNFLKVYKKEIEKGNQYYQKVLELDKDGKYKEMMDVLMKSKKG